MTQKILDIEGKRFGKLTVLGFSRRHNRKSLWFCQCDCGSEREVAGSLLTSGRVKTCGCGQLRRKGKSRTPLGNVWRYMIHRCNNPKASGFHNYGGRGIKVCDRWQGDDGLENFIADMGPTFSPGLELNRIDNDGPYSPDNCNWLTHKQNSRHRRTSVFIPDDDGGLIALSEAAERSGIPLSLAYARYSKGKRIDQGKVVRTIDYHGHVKSIKDWANILQLTPQALRERVFYLGWDIEKAFTTPLNPVYQRHS